jgi:hypothetical protein
MERVIQPPRAFGFQLTPEPPLTPYILEISTGGTNDAKTVKTFPDPKETDPKKMDPTLKQTEGGEQVDVSSQEDFPALGQPTTSKRQVGLLNYEVFKSRGSTVSSKKQSRVHPKREVIVL